MVLTGARRQPSVGDLFVVLGLLITLVLTVFLFIEASSPPGYSREGVDAWAVIAMFVMGLVFLGTVAAYGFSFLWGPSLIGVTAFGGIQIVQVCFHVFPLGSARRGMDLLWLLAGTALLVGAEAARRSVVPLAGFPTKAGGTGQDGRPPEARLKQLKQLHDTGLLSEEEYAEGRKQVLGNLQA